MSWIDKLVQTYDLNVGANNLIPLFHTEMNAQIIVTLDENAEFVDADLILNKENRTVIIPCTEDSSAGQTSGSRPHPLFHSLQYIAGDLSNDRYCAHLTEKKQLFKNCFTAYLEQLDLWCKSSYSNPFVCIVCNYLKKQCLTRDLIQKGILPTDSQGAILFEKPQGKNLSDKMKILAKAPIFSVIAKDLFKTGILFKISRNQQKGILEGSTGLRKQEETQDRIDSTEVFLWEDTEVRSSWQKYYQAVTIADKNVKKGFCQALGKEAPLARLHPKKIFGAEDNKLISGNDKDGLTFRGRFDKAAEAFAISKEASQKAHLALKWILEKQGKQEDRLALVAWAVDQETNIPSPIVGTDDLLSENPFCKVIDQEISLPDTAEAEGEALNKLIAGYSTKLNAKGLCLVVSDKANDKGTRAMYFRDLICSIYLQNIQNWHKECSWLQKFNSKRFYGAPALRNIAFAAYGKMKNDDPRIKNTVKRLLPCILDALPIPKDIENSVVCRTSRFFHVLSENTKNLKTKKKTMDFFQNSNFLEENVQKNRRNPKKEDETWEFQKNLGIACSVYRYNNQKRRKYTMALDRSIHSRDYLYGRLLAVAECLEYSALTSNETNRPTNAMRLMAHFAEHPYSTWRNLEVSLTPYKMRLASKRPEFLIFYEKTLEEIHQAFDPDDFKNDRPLSGEYLLGYYCQKADFFTKKEDKTENKD